MDEISVEDATTQICKNLPGLSREHANEAAAILVDFINLNANTAEENFMSVVERELRSGTEWAIQLAMASIRNTGN